MKRRFLRFRKFLTKRILHADDTSHAIAMGAACGMFAAIIPTIGMQTAVAVGLATLFRANKLIGVPMVWISNPFTAPPLIYVCYMVGAALWPTASTASGESVVAQFMAVCRDADVMELSFWKNLLYTLAGFGVELWVGSIVVGILAAIPTYVVTRRLVESHRRRHKARTQRRHLFRAKLRARRMAAGGAA